MDPVKVAYSQSVANQYAKPTGRCARCAAPGLLTPTRRVISPAFTGFDGWKGPAGGLCPACVWLYRTDTLRSIPHLVSQAPSFAALSRSEVYALLSQGPLKPTAALSVPLRPGRKHLFADIQWGTIRTDDANLAWVAGDAGRLVAVRELRRAGFTAPALHQATPDYQVLRRQPAETWIQIQHLWESLTPWRTTGHWLSLALTITQES